MRKRVIAFITSLVILSVCLAGCSSNAPSVQPTSQPTLKPTSQPTTITPTIPSTTISPNSLTTSQSATSKPTSQPTTVTPTIQSTTASPTSQSTPQPTSITVTTSIFSNNNYPLKLGESTIIVYNNFKKYVRVVSFNQQSGDIQIETKNIGDIAITRGSKIWAVDWGGVEHDSPDPWVLTDNFYPGESRLSTFNIYNLQDMVGKAMNGKLTLYYSLGDQKASWVIKES